MSISAEVLKGTLDAIEGGLAIEDPLFTIELAPESLKVFGLFEMADRVWEYKSIGLEAFLKEAKELPFE